MPCRRPLLWVALAGLLRRCGGLLKEGGAQAADGRAARLAHEALM